MSKTRHCLRIIFACLLIIAAPAASVAQPQDIPGSFADLVERLSPAVVNISTTQKVKNTPGVYGMPFQNMPDTPEFEQFREFFEQFKGMGRGDNPERDVYSLGSGFVIDATGYIVTNNHVIEEAEEISVTLSDNSKYKAKIIGRDPKTDLALLKIEPKKDLPAVTLGDSDGMRVGDWVIAIGNPYGLGGSVTQGIISARQRSINAGPFDDFLQTDAPINRGNSGGPLFNMKGEVIGINSAIFSPSGGSIGIGFAIPTSLAKPVLQQLREYGRTHRGWLGVKIQEVSDEVAESLGMPKAMGALVLEVSKDSPAAKAGVVAGDVITNFDGKEITAMRFLPRIVAETKIGKTVPVTIWRKGALKTLQIAVGEMDENEDSAAKTDADAGKKSKDKSISSESFLGMDLAPLNPSLRRELDLDEKQNGLAVVDVDAGSEAGKRGIRPGDVIVDVNSEEVKDVAGLKQLFANAQKGNRKYALVKILREKEVAFITLPTAEEKKPEEKKK